MTTTELVCGTRAEIARVFRLIVPRQPLRWDPAGLVCAPITDPTLATSSLPPCPLPIRPHPLPVAAWPDGPALMLGGWYVRTEQHASAPSGVRELVYAPGEGFGPIGHVTTAMCLEALDRLPACPAVDVGCGAGLLAQAWATTHRMPVLAIDLDPAAVCQARASCDRAGCGALVTVARRGAHALTADDLAGRVVVANVPAAAHRVLASHRLEAIAALVASGVREDDLPALVAGYRAAGLSAGTVSVRSRFACITLSGAA